MTVIDFVQSGDFTYRLKAAPVVALPGVFNVKICSIWGGAKNPDAEQCQLNMTLRGKELAVLIHGLQAAMLEAVSGDRIADAAERDLGGPHMLAQIAQSCRTDAAPNSPALTQSLTTSPGGKSRPPSVMMSKGAELSPLWQQLGLKPLPGVGQPLCSPEEWEDHLKKMEQEELAEGNGIRRRKLL